MKAVQNYKLMKNLNKLIRSGELKRPSKKAEGFFDVECVSFEIKCQDYDLNISTNKRTSSIYPDSHIVLLNDPQHKILPDGIDPRVTHVLERDTTLARMVFNRLERFYNKQK